MTNQPKRVNPHFKNIPSLSGMKRMSEEQVDWLLTHMPRKKLEQKERVTKAEADKEKKVEEYKRTLAQKRLEASDKKSSLKLNNAQDREAWVTLQKEVIKLKDQEIDANVKVKIAQADHEYLDDLFISARKQANKYEEAEKTNMQYAKYNT